MQQAFHGLLKALPAQETLLVLATCHNPEEML